MKPTILTGLRANSDLHIGNYFGALLPIIDMANNRADEFQINLFVPDLHSFTTPIDHSQLKAQINNNLKLYVAAGLPIEHKNVHIYRQSYISAHSELTLILNSFTGFGEMSRMTQFKDKSKSIGADRISVGLFDYPVLMASDILLYHAQYIPVGDDQKQHLEFTRDISQRINAKFGDVFTVPFEVNKQHEFFDNDQGLRIRNLANPDKKMSKSDDSDKGVVLLSDTPEVAAKKILGAATDSIDAVRLDYDNQPGISNLLQILALFKDESLQSVVKSYQGQTSYGNLKHDVAEATQSFLIDFQKRYQDVDESIISNKLKQSEAEMNLIANKTLHKLQTAIGLR